VRLVGQPGKLLYAESALLTPAAQTKLRNTAVTTVGGEQWPSIRATRAASRRKSRSSNFVAHWPTRVLYQPGQRRVSSDQDRQKPLAWQCAKILQLIQTRQREKSKLID